jgi:hypothetical protein
VTDRSPGQSICHIRSTIDDDGNAACLLEWGPLQALLKPPTVLATARDLMAAASAAETDIALVDALRRDLKLDDDTAGFMLTAVRSRRVPPARKPALRIAAVAGAMTRQPYVNIARGSMTGQLAPNEAREMAQHWTETAVAAQIDVRLRYALGEWDRLNAVEIEELFTLIQKAAGRG